jgi:hypothetical protein
MLVYPQLPTGAIGQFPIHKSRHWRTVLNAAPDGSSIKLADPGGGTTEWQLQYGELSDGELFTLQQFFNSVEGTLIAFTFLDPLSNLLAWSNQLDQSAWEAGPFLGVSNGIADPTGGQAAWQLLSLA